MKKLIVFIALLLVGGWFWRSPHAAVERLREATRSGDADQLQEIIDFEAVRANLKEDLRVAISDGADLEEDDPLRTLGVALGELALDPLIDTFVSAEGLAAVARSRMPENGVDDESAERNVHIDRRGPGSFIARFEPSQSQELANRTALEFGRRGMGWKLVRIVLPDTE